MRIKLNRTILESDNPLVVEQWKKAGYAEIGGDNKPPKDNEPQNNSDQKKDRKKAQE